MPFSLAMMPVQDSAAEFLPGLAYAASLIPDVTQTPQDIDDAMKLGFNWQRGPFEMMDAIGHQRMIELPGEADLAVPAILAGHQAVLCCQRYRSGGASCRW